jgi:hypothetical protein
MDDSLVLPVSHSLPRASKLAGDKKGGHVSANAQGLPRTNTLDQASQRFLRL